MARAPLVARLVAVALAATLPVACGSSSGGPTSAAVASPPAEPSQSPAALPAGLVAGSPYVFEHPHALGVQGNSDAVLFVDSAHASVQGVRVGLRGTEHEQLSIAGDQMTFSHAMPDGEDCHTSDVGVYRFTLVGSVLRLYAVKDTCSQRQEILVGHDLTLASKSVS
ncbi:MAG: hypothetical protein JWO88_1136 [Frankiales bacterium]|nr:hypothetical protein [Frankiales bacterium]